MTNHYELTYIVSIKYLDDELQKVVDTVTKMVKDLNGEITADANLGKQRLAYPIKHIHQGTYVVVEFDMPRDNMKKLDAQLKLKEEVLRHLIIKKRIKTEAELAGEAKAQERLRKEKEAELQQVEEAAKVKVKKETASVKTASTTKATEKLPVSPSKDKDASMEDLDKKLDEILTDDIL